VPDTRINSRSEGDRQTDSEVGQSLVRLEAVHGVQSPLQALEDAEARVVSVRRQLEGDATWSRKV
jgi:hypothetical protein